MSRDAHEDVEVEIAQLKDLDLDGLRLRWRAEFGRAAPANLPKHLVLRLLAYRRQAQNFGDLSRTTTQFLDGLMHGKAGVGSTAADSTIGIPGQGHLRPGTVLIREHDGNRHSVIVADDGFLWNGKIFSSLTKVAHAITGTKWNGPRFFGLRDRATGRQP